MRKQRTFNLEMAVFGAVGSGKSEYAIGQILDLRKKEDFYVIAHDAGYSIPRVLHDGRKTGVIRHKSIADCDLSLQTRPGGIHAIAVEDAGEVITFGQEVAYASLLQNTPGGEKAVEDGEGHGVPVIIYVDEIVRAQQASPHRLGPEMANALVCRRHLHCGFVFTSQSPHLCHYSLGSQATDIVIFHLNDDEDVKRLYKRMNVPRAEAEKAKNLKEHEYIHVHPQNWAHPTKKT